MQEAQWPHLLGMIIDVCNIFYVIYNIQIIHAPIQYITCILPLYSAFTVHMLLGRGGVIGVHLYTNLPAPIMYSL